ncbi:MAG: glycosyltransferase family 2 protein [Ginsengibacter sp.]
MPSLPSVAVVILNWNGKKFLEKFLPSVVASTYQNHTIVLGDNASEDDSVDFVKATYPQIKIIRNGVNEGFAKAYNTILKQVTADYYVLLNSDVEVTKSWIEPVIGLMESDEAIAACQPKILSFSKKGFFEYAGACGGWLDAYGYPFSRGRVFDICEEDSHQYDDVQQIFWATGAALFVRSSLYHGHGGFDEYFFAHQEEIDLCWRLQLSGYKIFVQPSSVVYHVGGGTLPMGNKVKVFLNFRNNLIMLSKNLSVSEALVKIPFRILLDSIAAWKGLLSGRGVTFLAIAKAHLHYWKWVFLKRDKTMFNGSRKKKLSGWYKGVLVWQYFINRRTRFSEIVENK